MIMNFDKVQIDILRDSAEFHNNRWHYYCADGGKILLAPRPSTMFIRLPHEECKLVLEKVADRNESMEGWYKRTTVPEELEKYKKLDPLGTVKPYFQQEVMYKLADEGRNFYLYIFPRWLKYVDLFNVKILAKGSESPVIIKEDGDIVQIVAPIRLEGKWEL